MNWKERVKKHLSEEKEGKEEIDEFIKKLSKKEVNKAFSQNMQDKFESEADEEEMEEFDDNAEEWYMSEIGDGSVEEETIDTFAEDLGRKVNNFDYEYFKNQMIKKFPFLEF